MQSTEYIDYRQYWFILRRRWLPATVVLGTVVVLTSLATLFQKPVYQAKGRLLIKTPTGITSAIAQEGSDQQIQQLGELKPVGSLSDPLKTEIGLIRSPSIAQKIVEKLNLELEPEELLENFSVENIEETDLLEVSYESTEPKEAALAVNQLMKLYLENNVLANRTEAAAARQFILNQLPKTKANVRQAEVILRKFEEENNVVNLEEEATSAVNVIANLENQVSEAQGELADVTAQSEELRKQLDMNTRQALAASSLNNSPGVQKALEELQQVESQLAAARTRYQEAHPAIVELKSRKASLEALLKGRIGQVIGDRQNQKLNVNAQIEEIKQQITTDLVQLEARRLGLAKKVSALSNVLANYKQRINSLPTLKQQKRELQRQLEAAQSTYETLLRRLQEIRVEENRNVGNVRIVEAAQVPNEPVAPNATKNLGLGSVLGILLAIGTALVLEALDTSIKTVKDAREAFGYTLQGIIPFFGFEKPTLLNRDIEQSTPKIVVRDTPRAPISEAYRMLQANLKFVTDKELKVIVLTSSVPQEGKSTISANLAMVMAQSGRKVLLVDADMRRPLQHRIWNLLNDVGLSNVIVGQAELKTAIKQVADNLHVLSAGSIPPNPMALLDSKRMASLIENFSDSYDFAIVDTPALKVAADALILGKMTDGVLLVVRPGVVDSASAASAKELLEQSGQNVLGQVINGVSPENKPYSYYAKEYYVEENSTTHERVMSESGKNADRS